MSAADCPTFSLIIPAFNEEELLPRLLATVEEARRSYEGGAAKIEVLVGNNASTDRTAVVAEQRGCRVVDVEKRSIGAARNGAAAAASGEVLCFVDADMRIHPQTFNVIAAALRTKRYVGGATGVRPERWSAGFLVTWLMLIPIVALMKMDTGVVFCRREDFAEVKGYDDTKLFAEDVDFLMKLRRLGRSRRQTLVRLRGAKAIASLRKFDEFGEWHYFRLSWEAAKSMFRRDKGKMTAFVERYWYKPRR